MVTIIQRYKIVLKIIIESHSYLYYKNKSIYIYFKIMVGSSTHGIFINVGLLNVCLLQHWKELSHCLMAGLHDYEMLMMMNHYCY